MKECTEIRRKVLVGAQEGDAAGNHEPRAHRG